MDSGASNLIAVWGIGFWILGIGIIFSLPMIWYHIGHVSRKLSRIIELLEGDSNKSSSKVVAIAASSVPAGKPLPSAVSTVILAIIIFVVIAIGWWKLH